MLQDPLLCDQFSNFDLDFVRVLYFDQPWPIFGSDLIQHDCNNPLEEIACDIVVSGQPCGVICKNAKALRGHRKCSNYLTMVREVAHQRLSL